MLQSSARHGVALDVAAIAEVALYQRRAAAQPDREPTSEHLDQDPWSDERARYPNVAGLLR